MLGSMFCLHVKSRHNTAYSLLSAGLRLEHTQLRREVKRLGSKCSAALKENDMLRAQAEGAPAVDPMHYVLAEQVR